MTDKGVQYWKGKYDSLCAAIQDLHESENLFADESVPDECISTATEFWVSNAMAVVDNELYAIENWGEGKYFKVVRVFERAPEKQELEK